MNKKYSLQQITKVIDWLVYDGVVKNRRQLASQLGYRESYFSQIMNGKVEVSDKFMEKLVRFDKRVEKMLDGAEFAQQESTEVDKESTSELVLNCTTIIESNIKMASALEKISESNLLLSQSNKDLTDLLKELSSNNKESLGYMDKIITAINERDKLGLGKINQKPMVISDKNGNYKTEEEKK